MSKENFEKLISLSKSRLLDESLNLVKPELRDEWIKYVTDGFDNIISLTVLEASVEMMKKFKEGLSYEEAENSRDIKIIWNFTYENGLKYELYYIKKYEQNYEDKEVVDNAIKKLNKRIGKNF